ncbi:MAG: DUF11 domain-containing protein [Saprospiraceae bacterium]|nr:DUF11 domain-containing protein [Saprospiraceae bacterium]
MQLPINKVILNRACALMCALVFGVIGSSNLKAQGWENYYGGDSEDEVTAVVQTKSEGYTILGFSESFGSDNDLDVYLARVDVDGDLVWEKTIDEGFIERGYAMINTADGGFLIAGHSKLSVTDDNFDAYLIKVDKDGGLLWSNTYGGAGDETIASIAQAADGGYFLVGRSASYSDNEDEDVYLLKVDVNGNEEWHQSYGGTLDDRGNSVVSAPDGGCFILGNLKDEISGSTLIYLLKTDASGVEEWNKTFGGTSYNEGLSLILDSDNNLVFTGHETFVLTILKTDSQGAEIWSKVIPYGEESIGTDLVETIDQNYALTGVTSITDADGEILLAKIDNETGDPIWITNHGRNGYLDWGASIVQTKDGGFVVGGYNSQFLSLFNDVTLLKVNGSGEIFTSYLQGNVFFDDGDCNYNGEPGLDEWLIEVKGAENTYYGSTNADGSYLILVDTGTYDVRVLIQNPLWEGCIEMYNGVLLAETYDTTILDFPIHGLIDCPLLEVEISTPYVIPCYDLTYSVYYSNQGPETATDVSISLTLDDELSYVSSTITPDEFIGDSLFIFNLNSLAPGETGTFELVAMADCDTETGQAVSVTAHIQPDSICVDSPDWDGSNLTVAGTCNPDSVRFQIRNLGEDMQMATNYIVIEDEVMAIAQPIDLPGGDSLGISVPSTGATYRIIAEQTFGHPGNSYPTIVVEGCTEDGTGEITVGNVLQFPEDEGNPFISIDVQETLDPQSGTATSLRGYPKGYLAEKLITPGTELEYQVFFQNTGLDTIFRVVVRDTLPPTLDLTSVRAGASSHPYKFEVYEEGYIKFIFENIVLPPQSVNPEESFGAVTFKVAQVEGNPTGTMIENKVETYMGFEEPVLSNTVYHEIGGEILQDFLLVSITQLPIPGTDIWVYPNPFTNSAILKVEGIELKAFELTIYDQLGRLVHTIEGFGNEIEIERSGLPTGTYYIRLQSDGRMIGTGKIVVQ